MKHALSWILLGFLCLVHARWGQAAPGWSQPVNTADDAKVTIEIASSFSQPPPSGFMPLRVTIGNRSGAARTYRIDLVSKGVFPMNGSSMTTGQTVTVENDQEAYRDLLLPMLPTTRGGVYYLPVIARISGYGVMSPQVVMSNNYRSSTGDRTAFAALSERLYTGSWGTLEKQVADDKMSLYGSRVDLTMLPADWRALAGVQCLWILPEDFTELDAAHRAILKDWVSRGGILYVCETEPDPPTRAEFGPTRPEETSVPYGFGQVKWFRYEKGQSPSAEGMAKEIYALRTQEDAQRQDAEDWPMAKGVGKLHLNTPFLLGFVGLFALLVGPFNLFYLARADRRYRLFWTTPAISLGTSLLLVAFIVVQDGFGGNGSRVALTYLLPDQNKAVTVQEQVARTGVLLGRKFTAADDLFLSPVNFNTTNNRQFVQDDRQYSGDWFASRSLQAQRIESIQPTRSRVQLLNGEPFKNGAPPTVVSSLPVELEELVFRDEKGRDWMGQHLRTGEPQTLKPGQSQQLSVHPQAFAGSPYLNSLGGASLRPGSFAAHTTRGQGLFIDTLRSIRWQSEMAFYLGPVVTDR